VVVWTRESFAVNARATAQGFSYALARFVAAVFALVTPAIAASRPSALVSILVAAAILSALIGSLLIRRKAWNVTSASQNADTRLTGQ